MASDTRSTAGSGPDEWAAFVMLGVGVLVVAVWSGAQMATLLATGHWLAATIGDGLGAMLRLPSNASKPALAWPSTVQSDLPGPIVYWSVTAVVVVVQAAVCTWLGVRMFSWRVGTDKRERLGVNANARFATAKDLRTIIVTGPQPGRFIMGRVGGNLVATENRAGAPTRRRRKGEPVDRQGDRSAVAVIGPQRSGKTVNVISGILEWEGPAILSSVRDDLFERTITRRSQLGQVFVFDPLESLGELPEGVHRVGWSPLHVAGTVSGAMEAASVLLEAAPLEGTTNANYWNKKGEALLWPILFTAVISGKSMADVVRWLALQDGNQTKDVEEDDGAAVKPKPGDVVGEEPKKQEPAGEIRALLNLAIADTKRPAVQAQARHALAQFDGFWLLDHRTRSDIFSTSQTLVQPWEDPYVSFASSPGIGSVVDLGMLLDGNNTLYVVQPLKSTQRFSVVFGGLLGALLKDQAYEAAHRFGGPLPDLLVVIDEAGNTPLQWLPQVASTCSGIGVLLVTVWQSKAQIDAIYQKQADPLLTNHGSKIFFAGVSDESTLRYVSYLGGEEEVHQRSSSSDVHASSTRRSIGDTTTHKRLLPAELLRQVMPGEGLLVHGTLPPAHIKSRRYWADPKLRALAAGEGEAPPAVESPSALKAALRFDRTPRQEILDHLPDHETKSRPRPLGDDPVTDHSRPSGPKPLGQSRDDHEGGIER